MTPAFHLHISKLDLIEPLPAAVHMIRRPVIHPAVGTTQVPPNVSPVTSPVSPPAVAEVAADGTQRAMADATQHVVGVDAPVAGAVTTEAAACEGSTASALPPRASAPKPLPPSFSHLVLDVDGVLVDSERASCESLRRAILSVTGLDIPHDFPADFYPVFGMDVRSCLEHYKGACGRYAKSCGGSGRAEPLSCWGRGRGSGSLGVGGGGAVYKGDGAGRLLQLLRATGMRLWLPR